MANHQSRLYFFVPVFLQLLIMVVGMHWSLETFRTPLMTGTFPYNETPTTTQPTTTGESGVDAPASTSASTVTKKNHQREEEGADDNVSEITLLRERLNEMDTKMNKMDARTAWLEMSLLHASIILVAIFWLTQIVFTQQRTMINEMNMQKRRDE